MRFRKLRIAWSVFWGLAAVLLIVLWVRSFWYADHADYILSGDLYGIESACGSLRPFINKHVAAQSENAWLNSSEPLANSNGAYEHSVFGWDAGDYPNY